MCMLRYSQYCKNKKKKKKGGGEALIEGEGQLFAFNEPLLFQIHSILFRKFLMV